MYRNVKKKQKKSLKKGTKILYAIISEWIKREKRRKEKNDIKKERRIKEMKFKYWKGF